MIDILSVACCSVQFPDKDWIESKVNLASIVPLRPFRRCLILISLLTQKASLSIRSRLWIPWFPRSRGIPLLQKKQKTNCLNGKFPLTHQLETSQFYFCKPSLSAVVFLCFLTLSATLGIQWFSLLSVAPRCEAKAQADVKFPTFHIQDTVLWDEKNKYELVP